MPTLLLTTIDSGDITIVAPWFQSKDSRYMHRFLSGCYAKPLFATGYSTPIFTLAKPRSPWIWFFDGFVGESPENTIKLYQFRFSRWWFQTFFIFTFIWGNDSIWLICFRCVETTNQFRFWFISPPMSSGVWGLSIQSRISWKSQAWISYDFMTRSPDATGNSFPNDQWLYIYKFPATQCCPRRMLVGRLSSISWDVVFVLFIKTV